MKEREKKDRRGPPTGVRTGPRARALQERTHDPYQHAKRPRSGPPRERLHAPSPGTIRLDPEVARVFHDSESVNEALRLVMRLARVAGGRPSGGSRERPSFRDRGGPPRRPDRPERAERPPPRRPKFEE